MPRPKTASAIGMSDGVPPRRVGDERADEGVDGEDAGDAERRDGDHQPDVDRCAGAPSSALTEPPWQVVGAGQPGHQGGAGEQAEGDHGPVHDAPAGVLADEGAQRRPGDGGDVSPPMTVANALPPWPGP